VSIFESESARVPRKKQRERQSKRDRARKTKRKREDEENCACNTRNEITLAFTCVGESAHTREESRKSERAKKISAVQYE